VKQHPLQSCPKVPRLSPEEKRLIAERVAAYRQNPGAGVSWAVAEADIRKQLGMLARDERSD